MRNVQMALVEQPMPFILLGEPDLLKMGFDARRHLGSVRETYHVVRLQYGEQVLA
jgi:hypothetical protein